MVSVSPIKAFLRQNGAKAVNKRTYINPALQKPVSACEFVGKDGKYLGSLKRANSRWLKGRAYNNYYMEANGMRQQRDSFVQYAKIAGKNGEKDKFVPELIKQESTLWNKDGSTAHEVRERVITSKLKQIGEDKDDKYKIYEALEPIKYEEKVISSGPTAKK